MTLGTAVTLPDHDPVAVAELARGATLGRYVVLDRLGAGGMGVVYAAYDPELDRKIALKLLRGGGTVAGDDRTARLQREAQAMARLSHPNTITVFDVGTHDGRLFIAMDYIHGTTLRGWLAAQRRTWREIVDVFVAAGRGLAAAHSADVIHRDFKPDNVLMGDDGRIVVVDFGLARVAGDVEPPADSPAPSPASISITSTGALLGTPPYMAPELWRGGLADPRSDQFAFCASLWEALYGQRPFVPAGDELASADEIALAILSGEVRPPPERAVVPTWVRQVVTRGLSTAAADRYPSMTAMLDQLARDPRAVRRRRLIAAAAVVVVAGGVTAYATADRGAAPRCRDGIARLAGAWDRDVEAGIAAAWQATDHPDPTAVLGRVRIRLDAYAAAWATAYGDACAAHQLRGEQSAELFDLRTACLLDRRRDLAALTRVLADHPDRTLIDGAIDAVGRLEPLDRCTDATALRAADPPPKDPAIAARVAAIGEQVATAQALHRAGRYTKALPLAEQAVEDADTIGHATARAQARSVLGDLYETLDRDEAEATLHAAMVAAAEAHDDRRLASAQIVLLRVLIEARRFDQAAAIAPIAAAAARRAGGDELAARLSIEEALLAEEQAKLEPARQHLEQAAARFERALGPDHERVALVRGMLARVYWRLGRLDESRQAAERARDIFERRYGPAHPRVATLSILVGANHVERGRYRETAVEMERAAAIYEQSLGPTHLDLAKALNNLGSVYNSLGRHDDARRALDRALSIKIARLGPDHVDVAASLENLANTLLLQHREAEAVATLRRALAIQTKARGADAPEVAESTGFLAGTLITAGKPEEALPLIERALAIRARTVGLDHPHAVHEQLTHGRALLAAGRPQRAIPVLERALATAERNQMGEDVVARIRFRLARALWDGGGDRRRAHALATQARDALVRTTGPGQADRDDVEAWLAAHRR